MTDGQHADLGGGPRERAEVGGARDPDCAYGAVPRPVDMVTGFG